jgi:hypothetical protein
MNVAYLLYNKNALACLGITLLVVIRIPRIGLNLTQNKTLDYHVRVKLKVEQQEYFVCCHFVMGINAYW